MVDEKWLTENLKKKLFLPALVLIISSLSVGKKLLSRKRHVVTEYKVYLVHALGKKQSQSHAKKLITCILFIYTR